MRRIPTNDLLEDLSKVGKELGSPPTRSEYNQRGRYTANTLANRFGSWILALAKAGWTVNRSGSQISSESLLQDLRRVVERLGYVPTNSEYTQFGAHSASALIERFGSWADAVQQAGYPAKISLPFSASDVVSEILRVSRELGRSPSRDEFEHHSNISRGPATRIFGSWIAALAAAGLPPARVPKLSQEELIDEIQRVARVLNRTPMQSDFRRDGIGKFAEGPFTRVFGSFSTALVAAGYSPPTEKNISKRKLLAELSRVAKELGHGPTLKDFEQYGKYGTATYVRRFGSWNGALVAGGWEPHRGRGIAVIAQDNREYDSFGEAELANLLYDSQLSGAIISYTPKVFLSEARKWTSDFLVALQSGESLYLEYDGFGPKRPAGGYDKLIPKIEFYKNESLPLIIVSPHEYVPAYGILKTLDELRQALVGSMQSVSKAPKRILRRTPAMLLDEIRRIAQEIGYPPSKHEFPDYSSFGTSQYLSIWGSWNRAVLAAGLVPKKRRDIPLTELLDHLRTLSVRLGRTPRVEDLRKSTFSPATYHRRFGSHNKALQEAGLDVNKAGKLCNVDLIAALAELAMKLNRTPTKGEMDRLGRFSGAIYTNHFGSWAASCEVVGLRPNKFDGIPDEALLKELRRLKKQLGRLPRMQDMRTIGKYTVTVYPSLFGSWKSSLHRARIT